MNIIVVALLCFAAVPVTPYRHEIHKRMKDDEVRQVFQTTRDKIPDYKVVQVEVTEPEGRSARNRRFVRITSYDDEINLLIKPHDGLLAGENTPVTVASSGPYGPQYYDDKTVMKNIGRIWEDTSTRSSFVVSQNSDGHYYVDGHIGTNNYAVKYVGNFLTPGYLRRARSLDGLSNSTTHVMFAMKENKPFPLGSIGKHIIPTNVTSTLKRKKRSVPSIIYPEILLVTDYSTYRAHGSNVQNVVKYFLALFNTVDMRFRKLQYPKVRLNIARFIVATDPGATPYVPDERYDVRSRLKASKAVDEASEYFYKMRERFPCQDYDMIMIMTRRDLTVSGYDNPLGYALIKGACRLNEYLQMAARSAIVHDDGSYCPWAPAHELGHLLGAHHDDETNPSHHYCPSGEGYVMTPSAMSDENSWEFSQCSQIQFHEFISTGDASCLYNRPRNVGRLLPRILPGQIMSIDEQCKMMEGTSACTHESILKEHDECLLLICVSKESSNMCTWNYGHGPAEGTPCDQGNGMCIGGRCVVQEDNYYTYE